MTTRTATRAADIIFVEAQEGGRWTVRFLNPDLAEGSILGRPVSERMSSRILTIKEVTNTAGMTRYEWTTPGETTHNGNRHESAFDLSEAQAVILRWVGRRFRTPR